MAKNIIEEEIIITKKLFYNNSFGIYGAKPKDLDNHPFKLNDYGNFTIKGKFQELILDVPYKVKLEEVNDKKHGLGYQIHSIYRDVPKTKEERKNFLSTMMTELQLDEIYKVYPDEDIIDLFKSNKLDYTKVKGFGKITYEKVRNKVLDNVEWQSLFAELGRYGIKFDTLKKLVDIFGTSENAIEKVKENPYLLTMIGGIGFIKADMIAKKMGISDTSVFRIHAALRHVVGEEEKSGHTYIVRKNLLEKAIECLVIDRKYIEDEIDNVKEIFISGDRIALHKTYDTELSLAKMLIGRHRKSKILDIDIDDFLDEQEAELGIKLTDQQIMFFHNFKHNNVNFLIGAAGTGKSQMQKILINLIQRLNSQTDVIIISSSIPESVHDHQIEDKNTLGLSYKLLAPTGRAAKVLSQYVGADEASTIHRAIGFGKREESSIDEPQARNEVVEDIALVDESGMMDVRLANALLRKMSKEDAKIVFIGDASQLPSVGAGNFLKDCIDSDVFPVTVLDKVFRQEEGGILDIATKARKGEKFIDDSFIGEKKFGKDALLRSVDQIHMEKGYRHYYSKLLEHYQSEDIMVLSPTRKGNLGTVMINKHIQSIVNPPEQWKKEQKYHDDCIFRVNDYVMNTKNTYEILDIKGNLVDIVNGDSGIIVDIVKESDLKNEIEENQKNKECNMGEIECSEVGNEHKIGIYIQFDVGIVAIPFERMDQLMHSWALTIHKSQGGSAKGVILIMDRSHKFQANANLIYTGITRCKGQLAILCQAESLNFALRKFENMSRRTFLREMLTSEYGNTT